ncbi:hypothetical protein GGI20_004778 [Coemansia sp. BCRC 34301]|nr:hypothetical protein GGI20_004778 [Coemansia sp. BCRC 34301]
MQWVKPAVYAASGVALVVFAWPVLRFVVIGGLAYGAFRLSRTLLQLRSLSQGPRLTRDDISSGGGILGELWRGLFSRAGASRQLVEQLRVATEASLRANIEKGDERLLGVLGEAGTLVLGDAMQVDSSTVQTGDRVGTRVEALFPVFVDGRATPLFVQAAGSAVPGVVEEATLLARMASGSVEQIRLDLQSAENEKKERRVQDAEYKDL